jgi:hypothetical protein
MTEHHVQLQVDGALDVPNECMRRDCENNQGFRGRSPVRGELPGKKKYLAGEDNIFQFLIYTVILLFLYSVRQSDK